MGALKKHNRNLNRVDAVFVSSYLKTFLPLGVQLSNYFIVILFPLDFEKFTGSRIIRRNGKKQK